MLPTWNIIILMMKCFQFFTPSSLDKEQFDKIVVQLFIANAPPTPFSSEIQPGAHSIWLNSYKAQIIEQKPRCISK